MKNENPEVTRRLIAVRLAYDPVAADFARRLEIEPSRWRNLEEGFPLPKEMALLLNARLGLSLDWLYLGQVGNMPKKLLRKLKVG